MGQEKKIERGYDISEQTDDSDDNAITETDLA